MAHRIRMAHWLVSGGLLLAATSASAQEGVLFKNLLEGVFGSGTNDIEYRQRPPLVVPPGSALPRPQDPASARNAAWPNDPDIAKRRAEAAAARVPSSENEKFRNNPLLSQQELRRGRSTAMDGRPIIQEEQNNTTNQINAIRVGRELAARRSANAETTLLYGEEPQRRTLTEPPVGYRRPAGTAALGPGARGPVEDTQAAGQREFLTGTKPMQ
ncbi:hypothetical protein [Bosea sp. PAMC 26642]|uniref:hypothetical protein n=1 Tax=Bosea sp. (strain PAMC 26642) TaxID=1792307 RepID=UPI0007700555|nr:hypothetical protein [Bosea sp. PAMC 26642]AMJ58918.1 hypothetical protein AXW83_00130 [Bosea sp. PAMC 26642]